MTLTPFKEPSSLPPHYHPTPNLLKDRVILVTGAGQGLGKAAAMAFAAHGATVILHGRNIPKLEASYDSIVNAGGTQPAILPLDFAKASNADLDGFAQSIDVELKRLDGIFHAATHFSPLSALALQDLDTWLAHLRVNVAVPAALTRACLPLLQRSPDASVVFLTETHALEAKAYWGAFATAKSALTTLTTIWSDEMEASTIRFNLCLPGPVASPLRGKTHPGELPSSLLTPAQLSEHFLYLMSSDSRALSGQIYHCQDVNK